MVVINADRTSFSDFENDFKVLVSQLPTDVKAELEKKSHKIHIYNLSYLQNRKKVYRDFDKIHLRIRCAFFKRSFFASRTFAKLLPDIAIFH